MRLVTGFCPLGSQYTIKRHFLAISRAETKKAPGSTMIRGLTYFLQQSQ